MSLSQSNLSASGYGYDFVVATTQESINATMAAYLASSNLPVAKICYVYDPVKKIPVQIAYEDLKKRANGSDPFTVPAGADPSTNKDLQNLLGASFMAGFQAQIGLPDMPPSDLPDIVTLGSDTSAVTFNMMCSEFIIVELSPGGYGGATWLRDSQPDGQAWMFTSKVDLRLYPTDHSAFDKLPPAVQRQIENLGAAAFSVQQLLFDLSNAALESIPTISGIGQVAKYLLTTYFTDIYFAAMQAKGSPLLGCAITQPTSDPSSLKLTSLNLEVCPLLNDNGGSIANPTPAQVQLATLNYLCETNNDAPIPPRTFPWNWVGPSDRTDGVIAINRDTFIGYFQAKLTPLISRSCYAPWTRVWLSGFIDQNVHFDQSLTANQTPNVTKPATGSTVLQYSYNGYHEDDAGAGGGLGHLTLTTSTNATVQLTGNTIVIVQHLVIWMYVKKLATPVSGNIVDKTITDTYTINVDPQGRLSVGAPTTKTQDNSEDPSANGFLNFFADADSIADSVKGAVRQFVATNFTDIPISFVQDFVFPGGNTFVFKNIQFSDHQDLTGQITYADPSQVHLGAVGPRR